MAQQTKIGRYSTTVANGRVVYFKTTIFAQADDGQSAVIWHGGYRTASTTTRINQALSTFDFPFHVHRRNGVMWAVSQVDQRSYRMDMPITICRNGNVLEV